MSRALGRISRKMVHPWKWIQKCFELEILSSTIKFIRDFMTLIICFFCHTHWIWKINFRFRIFQKFWILKSIFKDIFQSGRCCAEQICSAVIFCILHNKWQRRSRGNSCRWRSNSIFNQNKTIFHRTFCERECLTFVISSTFWKYFLCLALSVTRISITRDSLNKKMSF